MIVSSKSWIQSYHNAAHVCTSLVFIPTCFSDILCQSTFLSYVDVPTAFCVRVSGTTPLDAQIVNSRELNRGT
jgi:hypothetical protein